MSPASFLFVDEKKESKVFSVEEIYQFLLEDIRNDYRLQNILIEGEISNLYPRLLQSFSELRGKYLYCDLKGEEKSDRYGKVTIPLLHCAMWQPNKLEDIHYLPKEGDAVLVRGNLTIYKERGQIQFTITEMQPKGKGLLLMKLQALKEKLAREGLFLEEHKKPIPSFPMRIALLAGANTAAQADVHVSIARRWPLARIDDFPVPVQGSNAPKIICKTLKEIDEYGYDAIILARGGGSFEDLFYFNDEELARTIYQLQTFIVTGIGHEIDFTIAESVADLRAITPTAAAEKITPSLPEVVDNIHNLSTKIKYFTSSKIQSLRSLLLHCQTRPCFTQPLQHFLHPQERKLIKATNGLTVFREKNYVFTIAPR